MNHGTIAPCGRVRVTQVETHVAHACPLTCESCTHFSNEGYTGRHTLESFRAEVGPWASKILPGAFLLLGGEPTLNPDLADIVEEARRLWPQPSVRIMLVTNGWFLYRHPRLAEVLPRNRVRLDISIHHDSPEYLKKLDEIKALVRGWGITPYFRESFRDWTMAYRGVGSTALPYDDRDHSSSWKECASKWCLNVHEGKLWKCPVVAYLPMHVAKYGDCGGEWAPYLAYQPLEPGTDAATISRFVSRGCESICGMCPAHPQPFSKPSPLIRLSLPSAAKESAQ